MEDFIDLQKTADDFLKIVKSYRTVDMKMFLIQIKVISNWKFILEDHCHQEIKKIEQFIFKF